MEQSALEMMIEAEIVKMSKGVPPFAIFDFDNTCIVNDIGEATLAYLCRNALLKDDSLLDEAGDAATYHERVFHRYHTLCQEGQIKEAYALNSKMFSGFTPEEAEAVVRATIEAEGDTIGETELYGITIPHGLVMRPQTLSLMRLLKARGVHIWIVSASRECAVRVAMKHFGLAEDLVGVRSVMRDGVFTSELQTPMPIIEGKVACLRAFIDPVRSPLVVVDDSMTGLPILETATIKVAVDRGGALTKEAKIRGWFII